MHIILTEIQWDDEGQGLEECGLPESIILLDVTSIALVSSYLTNRDLSLLEMLGPIIEDKFGFKHYGFKIELLEVPDYFSIEFLSIKGFYDEKHIFPRCAIMKCPF